MAKRKCLHTVVTHQWSAPVNESVHVLAVFCAQPRCGERLSLGPSNDEPSAVQEEIEAAAATLERRSFIPRQWNDGYLAHLNDRDPPELASVSWRAGWLAREMSTWTERAYRDSDALAWDPTVPLTEQWPWNGAPMPDAAALEQTPSDIEALTARPSDSFSPVDTATREPWADPTAETRLTDDKITRAVAYSPPGSVRE